MHATNPAHVVAAKAGRVHLARLAIAGRPTGFSFESISVREAIVEPPERRMKKSRGSRQWHRVVDRRRRHHSFLHSSTSPQRVAMSFLSDLFTSYTPFQEKVKECTRDELSEADLISSIGSSARP
jgi:hypothetical protein